MGLGDEVGDASDLGGVAGRDHHAGPLAGGDQGGGVGHVGAIGQGGVFGQGLGLLLHRERLAGEGRLVDPQVAGIREAHVGRDLVAGLQDDDVAGHQLGGREAHALAVAHDRGLGGHGPRQRLDGLDRLGFLEIADDGVDHHHPEDDPGIDPLAQGRRDRPGRRSG